MAEATLPESIGPYRIESEIGRGGMGAVYRGLHETLERPAAIKLLPTTLADHPEYVSRFLREARTVATLRHDHIVQVYDAGVDEGRYFIAMELVDGDSLGKRLENDGRLEEAEGLELMRQAAEGLAVAHEADLVHRDIKPENLLLDAKGRLRIVDFGLVMDQTSNTQLTVTGTAMGTPHYMSPEQVDGEKPDARSDFYSLGVTFYRALTGRLPFESATAMNVMFKHRFEAPPNPSEILPALSSGLCRLLLTMMAKDPQDRPRDAKALVELIEKVKKGEPIPEPPAFQTPTGIARGVTEELPAEEGGGDRRQKDRRGGERRTGERRGVAKVWPILGGAAVGGVALALTLWLLGVAGGDGGQGSSGGAGSGLVAAGAPKPDTLLEALERANEAEADGEFRRAMELFTHAAQFTDDETEKERLIARGAAALRQQHLADGHEAEARGDWAGAARFYGQALELGDDEPLSRKHAELLQKAGVSQEAQAFLRDGDAAAAKGEWLVAQTGYEAAARLDPEAPGLQEKIAQSRARQKMATAAKARAACQFDAARMAFEQAAHLAPALKPEINVELAALAREQEVFKRDPQRVIDAAVELARVGEARRALDQARAAAKLQPHEAKLAALVAALEDYTLCEAVYGRGVDGMLARAREAADRARRADKDDHMAEKVKYDLERWEDTCTQQGAQVRNRFVKNPLSRLNMDVEQARELVSKVEDRFESARKHYFDRAEKAAEFRGVNTPIFSIGKEGDKEKAEKLRNVARTFQELADQASRLGR